MATRRFLVPLGAAILGILSNASASGMLRAEAAAHVARRPEDDRELEKLPLLALSQEEPMAMLGHRSHSSHRSHRSHSSHSSHYSGSSGGYRGPSAGSSSSPVYDSSPRVAAAPKPPPPKPAVVSFLAFPGGKIFVNGRLVGTDASGKVTLKPGSHVVRVQNRFLGEHVTAIEVAAGQSGVITVAW
jgi:hypothetical protein